MSDIREKTCCFTGHRSIPDEKVAHTIEQLDIEVGWLISHGITDFIAGGALGFDTLAALSVLRSKKLDESVKLHLALPCPSQSKGWSATDVRVYEFIKSQADSVKYISTHYHRGVMMMRNRYMVENSATCICYYDKELATPGKGGTLYTVNEARKRGLNLINLLDEPPDDNQLEYLT